MPKKEIESEPGNKQVFIFEDSYSGDSRVEVWCDGRDYDPNEETYRPRYSYSIITPKWRYDDNDIHGASNSEPDTGEGARALFSFLYACQEGMPQPVRDESETDSLFPPQVRDWAYHFSEQISLLSSQLEESEGNMG